MLLIVSHNRDLYDTNRSHLNIFKTNLVFYVILKKKFWDILKVTKIDL